MREQARDVHEPAREGQDRAFEREHPHGKGGRIADRLRGKIPVGRRQAQVRRLDPDQHRHPGHRDPRRSDDSGRDEHRHVAHGRQEDRRRDGAAVRAAERRRDRLLEDERRVGVPNPGHTGPRSAAWVHHRRAAAFSEVVSGLDIATNMDAETAATEMAQFANITRMSHDEVENYGSAIVGLGNNFATTEAEISSMAMRIAAAGTQAKDVAGRHPWPRDRPVVLGHGGGGERAPRSRQSSPTSTRPSRRTATRSQRGLPRPA